MIYFFKNPQDIVYGVLANAELSQDDIQKLNWLFGDAELLETPNVQGYFIGPRAAMLSPWSTNAVEVSQAVGIVGIIRMEEFQPTDAANKDYDPMLFQKFNGLDQSTLKVSATPAKGFDVEDIEAFNQEEGLAMSPDEVEYLDEVSEKIGRKLSDSEVFAFSQANSEHCRHKIFNGTFIIDGEEMPASLFQLIKKTSAENPNGIVSAYKDNVAFVEGPELTQFAPASPDKPDFYQNKKFNSVLSLKAETHNFPTTVEPFGGAATGSGGEIRDRMAGGRGAIPMAGTAVYMTAYSRLNKEEDGPDCPDKTWEDGMPERKWLYQTPIDILMKASNGASDYGNKFGEPLISGSILTFEHDEAGDGIENARKLGFDKVIMMAGGIGYGKAEQAQKDIPQKGDQVVILGGDNYRIGMGGAAVSSADTGAFDTDLELNAIQRSNPEMQKRAGNVIRGFVESDYNPIVSVHDHGAGGHLNCLSELVEDTGGVIDIEKLPLGDPGLSAKEIIGNESQERMGLVVAKKDLDILKKVADRERSPMYVVGEVTDDMRFTFEVGSTGEKPMDYALEDFFGSTPKTIMDDQTVERKYAEISYDVKLVEDYMKRIFQLESVGSKDWLTNKVDRSVSGRVAKQQNVGPLQLPLNNVGVMALDYQSEEGMATSIGHSPLTALIDPAIGSRNAIGESLANMVFAPIKNGLKGVSLSANWMWPCNNDGEDARLYQAVKACSDFAIDLGINIPTGKDSLSMKQKYGDGTEVLAPGTVIITAAGHCTHIRKVVEPVLKPEGGSIYYINLTQDNFKLGGSAFAQINNKIGAEAPDIKDAGYFVKAFNAVQELILQDEVLAGHDVSSGGLITTLLEMCFADQNLVADIDLCNLAEQDTVKALFNENIALVLQAADDEKFETFLNNSGVEFVQIGKPKPGTQLTIKNFGDALSVDINEMRDCWASVSYQFDQLQTSNGMADERFENYKNQPLYFKFPDNFTGKRPEAGKTRPKAAIIREKGSNSEREMANAMYLAGFDVKDVHMTDLISGRENLENIQFIGFVGGASNSDVLGKAKGWAAAIKFNEIAKKAFDNFFAREDTLSMGVCNGAQLMIEMGWIGSQDEVKLVDNDSEKFESGFVGVKIVQNNSIMLQSLSDSVLGVWIAHGSGKFILDKPEGYYNIAAKYAYSGYPQNPNGSDYETAMLSDASGRHLATMPHIERSVFQWNWPYYEEGRNDEVSPWVQAFVNARIWCENHQS